MSPDGARPQRDEVRRAVLEAAGHCFVEHGYRRVTVEQIARRAGYSKGAVYSNFAGKSDLFLTLLREVAVAQGVGAIEAVAAGAGGPHPVLTRAAEAVVGLAGVPAAGLLAAEFESEAHRDPQLAQRLVELRAEVTDRLVDRLDAALAALGVSLTRPTREVVVLLSCLVSGLALESVGADAPVVSPAAVEALLAPLLRPADDGPG